MRTLARGSDIAPTFAASRAALPPEGADPCSERPGAVAIAPTHTASPAAGFTLLELLVVVAIIAIGSAGVAFALRDGAQSQLEREAHRLAALLESARAQSRSTGVPIRWVVNGSGFLFVGLPSGALPTQWLDATVAVSAPMNGTTTLTLGPEPLIGRQTLVLSSTDATGRQISLVTDGLRPFAVQSASP